MKAWVSMAIALAGLPAMLSSQVTPTFTRADTLRGSNTAERAWWDAVFYDLLAKVFDQYLRTTRIPVLEYKIEGATLSYRWANVVPGFDMPVKVTLSPGTFRFIQPIESWLTTPIQLSRSEDFRVDENFYVSSRDVLKPTADSAAPAP